MAGDWIKFEVSTLDKQEVSLLADVLGIDHDAVIGKLLRVWAWADQNVTIESNGESNGDSVTVSVTTSFLDRLTFCPGFSKALESVGWLVIGDRQVVLPNFARHNGKTAKERGLAAKRAAKFKDKGNDKSNGSSVTSSVTSALPREEKRREEKDQEIDATAAQPASNPGKVKKTGSTFATWYASIPDDQPVVPDTHAVFRYGRDAGIPDDFLALAWAVFEDKYILDGQKRQKDWPGAFANYVKNNYLKLWWLDGQTYVLNSTGRQALLAMDNGALNSFEKMRPSIGDVANLTEDAA